MLSFNISVALFYGLVFELEEETTVAIAFHLVFFINAIDIFFFNALLLIQFLYHSRFERNVVVVKISEEGLQSPSACTVEIYGRSSFART